MLLVIQRMGKAIKKPAKDRIMSLVFGFLKSYIAMLKGCYYL